MWSFPHPNFKEKPLVAVWLMTDDFDVVWVHLMITIVDIAPRRNFRTMIGLFVLGNPRLQWSFGLAIAYKIALFATYFVCYPSWWTVGFCCFGRAKRLLIEIFCGLNQAWICCCFYTRLIVSETPWTYGRNTEPCVVGLVGLVANALSQLFILKTDVLTYSFMLLIAKGVYNAALALSSFITQHRCYRFCNALSCSF